MNICWYVGYKKVLQSLDVCLVKKGKDVLLMFPALLAIISFEVTFWEVLMMLFDQPKSVISFEVTFREVLMMLAIFDCFFITTASISFSLPQLSSYWKVNQFETHFLLLI